MGLPKLRSRPLFGGRKEALQAGSGNVDPGLDSGGVEEELLGLSEETLKRANFEPEPIPQATPEPDSSHAPQSEVQAITAYEQAGVYDEAGESTQYSRAAQFVGKVGPVIAAIAAVAPDMSLREVGTGIYGVSLAWAGWQGGKWVDRFTKDIASMPKWMQRAYGIVLGVLSADSLLDMGREYVEKGKFIDPNNPVTWADEFTLATVGLSGVDNLLFSKWMQSEKLEDRLRAVNGRLLVHVGGVLVSLAAFNLERMSGDHGIAAGLVVKEVLNIAQTAAEIESPDELMGELLRMGMDGHLEGAKKFFGSDKAQLDELIAKETRARVAEHRGGKVEKPSSIEAKRIRHNLSTSEKYLEFWQGVYDAVYSKDNADFSYEAIRVKIKEIIDSNEWSKRRVPARFFADSNVKPTTYAELLKAFWNTSRNKTLLYSAIGEIVNGQVGQLIAFGRDTDLNAVSGEVRVGRLLRGRAGKPQVHKPVVEAVAVNGHESPKPRTRQEAPVYSDNKEGVAARRQRLKGEKEETAKVLPADEGAVARLQQAVDEVMVIKTNGNGDNGNGHEGNGHEAEVESDDSETTPSLMQRLGSARTPTLIEEPAGDDDESVEGGDNPPGWQVSRRDLVSGSGPADGMDEDEDLDVEPGDDDEEEDK